MKAFAAQCAVLIPIAWLLGCTPEAVQVEQFALSGQHSCALLDDGTVKCWGFRNSGALADGSPVEPSLPDARTTAAKVQGLSAAASQIASGSTWTCALLKTGAVQCWGAPVGTSIPEVLDTGVSPPTTVPGLEADVSAISAQDSTACALKADGSIWCWGWVPGLQMDPQVERQDLPVLVTLPLPARLIAVSAYQSCAALVDGSVWCWGHSDTDFFNQPKESKLQAPTPMGPLPSVDWLALGASGGYACALAPDAALYCWGRSPQVNSEARQTYEPAVVDLGAPVEQVSLASNHACAVLKGGAMRCWGNGEGGQLGLGNVTARDCAASPSPCIPKTLVAPAGLGDVRRIGTGPSTTCAAQTDGEVLCWGQNSLGALGSGTRSDSYQPTPVLGL